MTISAFRRWPRRLSALLLSATALTPTLVLAQSETTPPTTVLDEIVITASGFEQNVEDAPASITVISGEELRKANVTSLSDALRSVQGVATTGTANEQDIQIRGLPGQYTLILVDGKRQGTRESRTNGSAGFEQSFIPPVGAIERIEVVRGPMSSLYGSDAMGGVVNIITKSISDVWSGEITVETTLPQRSEDGSSRQYSFYANGPVIADQLGLQFWGRSFQRSEAKIVDGVRDRDLRDLSARLTWTPAEGHDVRLEGGRSLIEDLGRVGNSIPEFDSRGRPQNDSFQENERKHASLSYSGQWEGVRADLSVLREVGQRTTYSGNGAVGLSPSDRRPEITNTVYDAKFSGSLTWQGEHTFVFGGQHSTAALKDQNPGIGDGVTYGFESSQWAILAEDEWQITPDLALTLGARHTDHNEFGGHVTPRIYAVWNATPDLTVKGGVSTGFRTPDLRSIVSGYYYTTQQGLGVIVSNPDLQPEESLNAEIGALYNGAGYQLGATVFRTDFDNKIESRNTGESILVGGTSYNRWEWYNVGEAVVQGVELTAAWDATSDLSIRASYTFTDSEQKTGDFAGLPLQRNPRHAAQLRADWITPVSGLEAWGAINYHGKEINAGARIGSNGTPYAYGPDGSILAYEYDAYTTVDIGAGYDLGPNSRLNGAIYNLFDTNITAAESNTVGEGRRLWLGLTAEF